MVNAKNYYIGGCGTLDIDSPSVAYIGNVSHPEIDLPKRVLIADYTHDDCIRNSDASGTALIVMIFFSIGVQMAEGLHFGVVPSVSKPALGIVSGMVGAGGNAGAVISLWAIFKNPNISRTDEGFVVLGVTVIVLSLLMWLIYFPDMGSMALKAGSLKYDPQRIKPPSDYRGSSLNYDAVNDPQSKTVTQTNNADDVHAVAVNAFYGAASA